MPKGLSGPNRRLLHTMGKVIGINSLISYEGESVESLKEDFEAAVDDYLDLCAEKGLEPEKVYRGLNKKCISAYPVS